MRNKGILFFYTLEIRFPSLHDKPPSYGQIFSRFKLKHIWILSLTCCSYYFKDKIQKKCDFNIILNSVLCSFFVKKGNKPPLTPRIKTKSSLSVIHFVQLPYLPWSAWPRLPIIKWRRATLRNLIFTCTHWPQGQHNGKYYYCQSLVDFVQLASLYHVQLAMKIMDTLFDDPVIM